MLVSTGTNASITTISKKLIYPRAVTVFVVGTLLKPAAAAKLAGVSTKTLVDWVQRGLIACLMTPGGQRRYDEDDIKRVLVNYPKTCPTCHKPVKEVKLVYCSHECWLAHAIAEDAAYTKADIAADMKRIADHRSELHGRNE